MAATAASTTMNHTTTLITNLSRNMSISDIPTILKHITPVYIITVKSWILIYHSYLLEAVAVLF